MIRATRPIKRETAVTIQGKPICVEIGDYGVHLWLKGSTARYQLPYSYAFTRAAKLAAGYEDPPADRRRKRYHPGRDEIGAALHGKLSEASVEILINHLAECPQCLEQLHEIETRSLRERSARRARIRPDKPEDPPEG